MKFKLVNRLLEEELLHEDIAAVKKNFPDIPDDKFMQLIKLDPTYKEGRDSVGTYGKWILNLFKKGKLDNIGHVKDVLTRFEENKKYLLNKDINSFKTLDDLDVYLNDENNYKQKSHSQEVRDRQKDRKNADLDKDATKVFEGDGFDVWVPHTYAASCKLGQGSRWCTASTENDYYYNYYKDNYGGEYYILINQSNPEKKYQFHFESNQFMDKNDYEISLSGFFRDKPNLKEFFIPKIKTSLGLEGMKDDDIISVEFNGAKEIQALEDGFENRTYAYYNRRDRVVTLKVAMDIIDDPYSIFSDDYRYSFSEATNYIPDFSDDVKEQLKTLGVDPEHFVDSLEEMDETNPELADNIRNAYTNAYNDGEYWGMVNEAVKDIENALDECDAKYDGEGIKFSFTVKDMVDSYLDADNSYDFTDPYFSDKKEELALMKLCNGFKVEEPYNGWYGFSDDGFNWRFEDELGELI